MLICFIPMGTHALGVDFIEMPMKQEISITKPWTVKFNLKLDKNTINSENVLVKDSNGKMVKVSIEPGKDENSIRIYPPTGGYTPGKNYHVELTKSVKSKDGVNLSKVTKMPFKTSNQYEDSTNYPALPTIRGINVVEKIALQNKKTSFEITPNYSGEVQYRIYLFKYPDEIFDNSNFYPYVPYIELTNGYTSSVSATAPYTFVKPDGFSIGKYKLLIYIKDRNSKGEYKDANTSFDNYYSTYFRVMDKTIIEEQPANATISYIGYNKTLEQAALEEYLNGFPTYSEGNTWMRASKEIIKYYMNPNNFLDTYYKDKFLNLNYMEVAEEDLNNVLKGKGVFEGKGAVFLKAARDNNINPIYLVGHALLETSNGKSSLATGILMTEYKGAPLVKPQTVHNMFGVKAYDYDPIKCGSEYAYEQGWFSVDEAIMGGAKFINNDYINNPKYNQNTMYKMRWNFNLRWHQYATDTGWARKQIDRINFAKLLEQCTTARPVYEIPIM